MFQKKKKGKNRKKERKKQFPAVERKRQGTQVGYVFRIRQLFADFIVVLDDGTDSCTDGDCDMIPMMTMMTMTAVSHALDNTSEIGHAKLTLGKNTDLRH